MKRFILLGLITLSLMLAIASCNADTSEGRGEIVVASKNFTEQNILGELLAQQIESATGIKVDRRLDLGGTFVCHQAMLAGQVDAYIEYTGTAFTTILKQKPVSDPKAVYQRVKSSYEKQFQLEVTPALGFENTFAMIIRGEDARKHNLRTLSQAAQYSPQWQAAFGYEFISREDGFPGLAKTYDIKLKKPPRVMDLGLIYRAIVDKQVDIVAGNSTDAQISRLDLTILQDDKGYFPPYEATPIVRQATLKKYPQLRQAIAQLGGKISPEEMRSLNYQVEGEFRSIKEVVSKFLRSKGLGKL